VFRYFYEAEGMECINLFTSLGRAIDAALMDFSSGQTHPTKILDAAEREILDFHDLHWIYSRTWYAEYDRVSGAVTPRG